VNFDVHRRNDRKRVGGSGLSHGSAVGAYIAEPEMNLRDRHVSGGEENGMAHQEKSRNITQAAGNFALILLLEFCFAAPAEQIEQERRQ
jgi:hypothetical protein